MFHSNIGGGLMSTGKIIGGLIGAIVGGPLGAGVGLFLGACADDDAAKSKIPAALWMFSDSGHPHVQCPHCLSEVKLAGTGEFWNCGGCSNPFRFQVDREVLLRCKDDLYNKRVADLCLFQVLGCISRSDGILKDEEINFCDFLMNDMAVAQDNRQDCVNAFKEGLQTGDFQFHAKTLGTIFAKDLDTRVALSRCLTRMAMIDGEIHRNELQIIHDISLNCLGIYEEGFRQIVKEVMYEFAEAKSDDAEVYAAFKELECDVKMTHDQVKRKYRELCIKFHPDTISSKQLPPEFIKFANDKLQALNRAYEIVSEYYKYKAA